MAVQPQQGPTGYPRQWAPKGAPPPDVEPNVEALALAVDAYLARCLTRSSPSWSHGSATAQQQQPSQYGQQQQPAVASSSAGSDARDHTAARLLGAGHRDPGSRRQGPRNPHNILDGAHLLATASPVSDPMHTIVAASVAGTLTADTLDELVDAAAHTQAINTYVGELRQRSERLFVAGVPQGATQHGACDELLGTLRPIWDEHAAAVAEARSLLGSAESSAEHILAVAEPGAGRSAGNNCPDTSPSSNASAQSHGNSARDSATSRSSPSAAHAETTSSKTRRSGAPTAASTPTAPRSGGRAPAARVPCPTCRCASHLDSGTRDGTASSPAASGKPSTAGRRGGWIDEDGKIHEYPPPANPYTDGDATVG